VQKTAPQTIHREDIIHSAAQIFRKKGYHATSMQDIAEAVHLRKASLYHHIHSKQEILLAILDEALDVLISDLKSVVESPLSPEAKLRLAMRNYIDRVTSNADLAAVLLLEHRNLDPELSQAHIQRRDRFEAYWREIVREGVERGAFRTTDEIVVSLALLGVQNWLVTWYRDGGRLEPAELADRFANLFLDGLRAHSNHR